MDKKSLKWYEAPAMELINVNVESQLLAGSVDPDDPLGGMQYQPTEEDE